MVHQRQRQQARKDELSYKLFNQETTFSYDSVGYYL
jgi:hypothetical protein